MRPLYGKISLLALLSLCLIWTPGATAADVWVLWVKYSFVLLDVPPGYSREAGQESEWSISETFPTRGTCIAHLTSATQNLLTLESLNYRGGMISETYGFVTTKTDEGLFTLVGHCLPASVDPRHPIRR